MNLNALDTKRVSEAKFQFKPSKTQVRVMHFNLKWWMEAVAVEKINI